MLLQSSNPTTHHWLHMAFLLVVDKREEFPKGNGVRLNLLQRLMFFIQPLALLNQTKLVPLQTWLLQSSLSHLSAISYSNILSKSHPTGSDLSQSPLPASRPNAVPYGSVQSASCLTSVGSLAPVLTQNQTINIHPSFPGPSSSTQAPSTNPFFLRFIQGNIRMCQGCRTSLRTMDGCVPNPPFDLAVARFECRTFRDKNGELHTPLHEQAVHYHLKPCCI